MSVATQEFITSILSKNIDKQAALAQFEKLSDANKTQLLNQLKSSLIEQNLLTEDKLAAIDQRELSAAHRQFISELTQEYEAFVPQSKKNIGKHQVHFVDQRRPFHLIKDLKKMHFQITYKSAEGAYVRDIDGNQYIDISGDMGVNIFGHKYAPIVDAVKASLDQGIPLAGYSNMIFETCELFSKMTGHERVLFTQSGTEAVMFAVRIARAATQKKKVVIFDGAYHGLSDAVTAMADLQGNSLAVGPGMLQEYADQLIVLDYGSAEQLKIIEQRADEIACVLVEPVQSRHPYIKPTQFLKALRTLTLEQDIPLIFDEMITGFRVGKRGAQGYFGIKADIATYGKIPGGGLPTGVIAGSAKYLDLVDGGTWDLDDGSMPKSKRTGMAGTHTQNPLKIAAAHAVLTELDKQCSSDEGCSNGSCIHTILNDRTAYLAQQLNQFFRSKGLPVVIDYFGSLFRFRFVDSYWGITEALFFILLRMNGVETNIQGNCFLTMAHTEQDIEDVIRAVKTSMSRLIDNNFFKKEQREQHQAQETTQQAKPKPANVAVATPEATPSTHDWQTLLNADLKKLQQEEC
ncbi:aminotransferase class III-fold pyridoxal phosphate-dependent enzyme [Pseudoalteromonas sp. J010]|uniref:aspartate aminotransferase family protein n=1 Tax=Pseudoalteromonas sp. J010 TaxID=998465 RepID=UPI000F6549FE|nr:aminotransferase class III-fold pyridoxal phosphate-dependent enzyme [Pseudoalteromonas sp. J010]RRS06758.1 aminotransferase class III-fold pyridoxal phosphate-dependent enzyme [Pseudoalteromonas sp. J010]